MSKSKHNSISPESVVAQYGADTLRGYLVFMGPYEGDATWNPMDINGVHRWLARVWDIGQPAERTGAGKVQPETEEVRRAVNKAIKKVGSDLATFQFNTAVSTLMELTNLLNRVRPVVTGSEIWDWAIENLLLIMAPITPYITEELWHRHGREGSIHLQAWPEYDEALTVDEVVTVVVQVNGKLRDRLEVPRGEEMESVREQALASPRVAPHLEGKTVVKVVTVPDKLVNIVVR